jgi:hypothetical protein
MFKYEELKSFPRVAMGLCPQGGREHGQEFVEYKFHIY